MCAPYFDLLLQSFKGFDQLAVVFVGMVQLDLHLVQVRLHFLLQSQSLGATFSLCLQASLQRLYGTLMVFPKDNSAWLIAEHFLLLSLRADTVSRV